MFRVKKYHAVIIIVTIVLVLTGYHSNILHHSVSNHWLQGSTISLNWRRSKVDHSGTAGAVQKVARTENSRSLRSATIRDANHVKKMGGLLCEEVNCTQLATLWKMAHAYASFHAEGVKLIRQRQSSSVRTLTWYCSRDLNSCGGLGFRFRGMTITWILGMLTGRVVLFKWSRESTENKHLVPNMIDWRYLNYKFEGSVINIGNFKRIEYDVKKYEHLLMKALLSNVNHVQMHYNLYSGLNYLIYNSSLFTSVYYGTGLPGMNISSIPHTFERTAVESVGIISMFKFSDKLQSYVSRVQTQIDQVTRGYHYVALHIRTGKFDGFDEAKTHKRLSGDIAIWKNATECALKQANKHIGPNSIVIVVSDSAEAKRWVTQEYRRVKTFDTIIVHIDRSFKLDEEGMLGIWQDITIMARSLVLVKHWSSFPDIPIAMCGIPSSRIIDYATCDYKMLQ
ncbi:uncharacterized protein [Dysidea avara]|uniref:uncharacterized protein n=1 Tax=Dysidea avara TaxID=196820 RepID=UPI0033234B95